jgi:signal transduction histidine kinase
MSEALGWAGWAAAVAGLGLSAALQRELSRRRELVARACHELRGPLTAARLGLHFVARAGGSPAGSPIAAIDGELRRAGLALDDLHAARTGRRVRDRAGTVEIGALLGETGGAWRPVAQATGRELVVSWSGNGALVRGDRTRLAQACGNLLANAIEHGAGQVELAGRADGRRVRIEVRDEGGGLSAPVAELARRARSGRGARGRGLAIASDIAARHGGRLASAPAGRGCRVVLELPLAGLARRARA